MVEADHLFTEVFPEVSMFAPAAKTAGEGVAHRVDDGDFIVDLVCPVIPEVFWDEERTLLQKTKTETKT